MDRVEESAPWFLVGGRFAFVVLLASLFAGPPRLLVISLCRDTPECRNLNTP